MRNDSDLLSILVTVTPEMNEALCFPVSEEEIHQVVFQMGAFKAPGPDGYQGMFYHKYWSIIK